MLYAKIMSESPANERVRQRIKEWVAKEGHGAQRRLAEAVPAKYGQQRSDSWVSDILNKRADVTLRDLDAVADHLGIPPGELVRKHDRNYFELRMIESKLLMYFRALPVRVADGWMLWLDFMFQHHEPIAVNESRTGWLHPGKEDAFRKDRKLPPK